MHSTTSKSYRWILVKTLLEVRYYAEEELSKIYMYALKAIFTLPISKSYELISMAFCADRYYAKKEKPSY